jgi:hypothetical protein
MSLHSASLETFHDSRIAAEDGFVTVDISGFNLKHFDDFGSLVPAKDGQSRHDVADRRASAFEELLYRSTTISPTRVERLHDNRTIVIAMHGDSIAGALKGVLELMDRRCR